MEVGCRGGVVRAESTGVLWMWVCNMATRMQIRPVHLLQGELQPGFLALPDSTVQV